MDFDADIYQRLFDVNPRPTWLFDRATRRFLLVNEAAIREYGWSREEFLAMTLGDLRPPEDRPGFEAAWAAPKESATYKRAGRHWKKNGEVIEVDMEISSFPYQGRTLTLATVTNVTGIADAERRFKLFVEHSAEAICVNREDLTVEYISPAGERILGYPPSELIGQPPFVAIHPDDGTWQPPAPFETTTHVARFQHRDGSWRWIESTTTNLLRDPAVRAYVTNYRDITARREAEAAMGETQRRLEYLLSATSAVTYSALASGDYGATFISANVESVMGHRPEQFVSDSGFWLGNIHPEDRPHVEVGLQELFAHGSKMFDYRFRHADGSWRYMRDAARVIRNNAGAPVEIVGYWIDITEQYEAQQSLKRSEANFRALIERSPTATYVQRDGTIVYANPAAVALFGYQDAAEMVGLLLFDLVHPDDREHIRSRVRHTVEHGTTPAGEGRMIRRDGSVFVAEAEALRLAFDGEIANVVFARDVTERREMFARMALADRMLTVGTLAAGVAHEINNPLSYVATNLEILARAQPNELLPLIGDAREGVARVSAIVRDLRALAMPEDDARGPVDVAAVLASSIKMAYNEIRHRATVVESYAPDLPLVVANASRLGQVFLNLLLNAAQAIPEGRADRNQIRVRARTEGERVVVEIEDTGVGIPAGLIKRIFDPFFTTKAPGVGMGLGLAISHQIVRAMEGEITVSSTVGSGTTFRVALPVAKSVGAVASRDSVPHMSAGARILLVDDEPAVGRALVALLDGDHDVVPVMRARDALDRLAAGERYDVILCDLMMPEVSGIELYASLPDDARDRIVFMTGGAFTQQAREFLASCDRPQLAKPFTEKQLRDVLERVRPAS